MSAAAYDVLKQQPEVTDVVESIGADETGEVRIANLYISLVPREDRDLTQQQWEERVLKELRSIPDARINFQNTVGRRLRARHHHLPDGR